jgi:hypothetical protein
MPARPLKRNWGCCVCFDSSRQRVLPSDPIPHRAVEPLPESLLTTALPVAVWEDHLLPLVEFKEAARLGGTCKALGVVMREHFSGDLGSLAVDKLQAALTTFPRARSVKLYRNLDDGWGDAETDALVEWMRVGGYGSSITSMTATASVDDDDVKSIVHEALRRGALPSLTTVAADLTSETQREALTGGVFKAMHELRLRVSCSDDLEDQFEALGIVGQLPALAKLELEVGEDMDDDDDPVQWPPFLPPCLKVLRIELGECDVHMSQSLVRALPGMLETSGAGLERLEVLMGEDPGHGLIHVAQALRCCTPTLKRFRLAAQYGWSSDPDAEGHAEQVERRRVQWADVLACLSACRELEVLVLPDFGFEPLFPLGAVFGRLLYLEIRVHDQEHPPDAGVVGLWELMASGGLPALADLCVALNGRWGGAEEVRARVAPALEAVADTLRHLRLSWWEGGKGLQSDDVDMGYGLGAAMGKLRRLKALTLQLSQDGRFYHAVAQGLATSGRDRPLPRLWRLVIHSTVGPNADLLASLVLPSVEVFVTSHEKTRPALLTATALRQAGYKHVWAVQCRGEYEDVVRTMAECRLGDPRLYGFRPYYK